MALHTLCCHVRRFACPILTAVAVAACGGGDSLDSPPPSAFETVLPSLPLVIAPRITASPDGTAWLSWIEGDTAQQSLVAARIDGAGGVQRFTVVPITPGALRDQQIVMAGATPVLVWRRYESPDAVTVNVASFANGGWRVELSQPGSRAGDISAVPVTTGSLALGWVRIDTSNHAQVVAAERSPSGTWSSPSILRTLADGVELWRSSLSPDTDGGLMALWSEAADDSLSSDLPPQTLWSSRSDDGAATWSAPLIVDTGRFYYSPSMVSVSPGRWLAAWMQGNPSAITSVVDKRFDGTGWSATTERIDSGDDGEIRNMVLASANHRIFAAWMGIDSDGQAIHVRAATLDDPTGGWPVPTLVDSQPNESSNSLELAVHTSGVAALACGASTPLLATTDSSGRWQDGTHTDLDDDGLAPRLSLFSGTDVITTWFRYASAGRSDIVVRRIR